MMPTVTRCAALLVYSSVVVAAAVVWNTSVMCDHENRKLAAEAEYRSGMGMIWYKHIQKSGGHFFCNASRTYGNVRDYHAIGCCCGERELDTGALRLIDQAELARAYLDRKAPMSKKKGAPQASCPGREIVKRGAEPSIHDFVANHKPLSISCRLNFVGVEWVPQPHFPKPNARTGFVYITVVREPLAWLIRFHERFLQQKVELRNVTDWSDSKKFGVVSLRSQLTGFLRSGLSNAKVFTADFQHDELIAAKRVLDMCSLVLVLEHMDEEPAQIEAAIHAFDRLLGWSFDHATMRHDLRSCAGRTRESNAAVFDSLPSHRIADAKRALAPEYKLYEHARAHALSQQKRRTVCAAERESKVDLKKTMLPNVTAAMATATTEHSNGSSTGISRGKSPQVARAAIPSGV